MAAAHYSIKKQKFYIVSICFSLLLCSRIVGASQGSTVRYLPGFTGPLPFELETGYISVDDTDDVQLFYYFIKSERKPSEDPLVLWTSGGPGCSAFNGLVLEIGPLHFKVVEYDGKLPTLLLNPNSWTKVSNIIFLDVPVGAGFSYSRSLQGSFGSDTKSAKYASNFLRNVKKLKLVNTSTSSVRFAKATIDFLDFCRNQWLINHPEFISNPLYIGGDSYAGMVVPGIMQDLSNGIEAGLEPLINLKGYLLGNPVTDQHMEENSRIPFVHNMEIISDELYESVKENCAEEYANADPSNEKCEEDLQAVRLRGLDIRHILEPKCSVDTPRKIVSDRRTLPEYLSKPLHSPPGLPELRCRSYAYMLAYHWVNDDRVQKALNVREVYNNVIQKNNTNGNKQGTVEEWVRCNRGLNYIRDVKSMINYHRHLSEKNYRSLIYSGDHDYLVPTLSTKAWIRSLNYSITRKWRPWFVDGQVAGYTRTYSNNMTFATLKGAGHIAPEYQPKECFAMFRRWISQDQL